MSESDSMTGYTIQRPVELGATVFIQFNTGNAKTAYIDATAAIPEAGTVYTYQVRAERGDASGDRSASVSVEMLALTIADETSVQGDEL